MARKKAVRRENGRGTVEKTSNKTNPFKAKVAVGTKVDKNGKKRAVYKSFGYYASREDTEDALLEYSKTPYDLTCKVNTFADLYKVWSSDYFHSSFPKQCIFSFLKYTENKIIFMQFLDDKKFEICGC